MHIATKLNLGIIAVFIVGMISNFFVLQLTIKPKFNQIEVSSALMNQKRVTDALEALGSKYRGSAQDWAYWSDTYKFAEGEDDSKFVDENLTPAADTLAGLGVNAMIIRSTNGTLIWGDAYSLDDKSRIEGFAQELTSLDYRHPFLDGEGDAAGSTGLIRTSKGLVLVAIAPILRSDRTGPAKGTVMVAGLLDESSVRKLTGVDFVLEPIPSSGTDLTATVVPKTLDSTIETSSLISDLGGKPLVVLRANTPRDVSKAGAAAIQSAAFLMLASATVVILALWLFVRRIVITRIEMLTAHFAAAARSGRLSGTQLVTSDDEIGILAKSFNEMAEQVNSLRDALADSAYLSGIAEWAAGTLHNVRNGLFPINVNVLKVQDLFEAAWVKNTKTAVQQLESADTLADRREKLAAYIVSIAPMMLDSAERSKTLLRELSTASKALEDIVAGYEKFSRHETVTEDIDLRQLIESIAKTTVSTLDPTVQLSLPPETAVVAANRTVLRQLFANLVINAIEAMHGQDEKRVCVAFQAEGGLNGGIKLMISDTGHGIASEHLKLIFERGYSTRNHKVGGLGLHWCANAAKSLGGSLRAESNGPGTGATLVLTLPQSKPALSEAA